MRTRKFIDAPDTERCQKTIPWGKGETSQCGRRRKGGSLYCWQHDKVPVRRNKTAFTVFYGMEVAKFSSNREAMYFAESKSMDPNFSGWTIEVHHKSGIVGQYFNGKTTPEFELFHELRDNG